MPKLGRKALCPCGTGMTYEDCCLNRKIKWMVDKQGKTYRVATLSSETTETLIDFMKEQTVEFKKIFGKEPGPEDFVFFQDAYLGSPNDMTKDIVKVMIKAGLPHDKIYATRKTGLIPTKENWDKLTTKDIEDWREAIDEYYEKLGQGKSPLDEEESHPLKEVQALLDMLPNCLMILVHVCARRKTPIKDHRDVISVSSVGLIQFCLAKSEMNMKAIALLLEDPKHRADALNLTRSLYENYLTLVYTRKQPQRMAEIFDAKAGLKHGFYEYCTNKNGQLDRTRAREKGSEKPPVSLEISKKEMAKSSDYEEDLDIYMYLYHFLSSYTHADIGIIFDYMEEAESGESEYSEFVSEATVFSLLVVTMILDETRKTDIIDMETKSDITRFLLKIIPRLIDFFERKTYLYESRDYSKVIKARLDKTSLQI